MNNRIVFSPILPAIVFALVATCAPADLSVPASGYSAPGPLEVIPAPPTTPATTDADPMATVPVTPAADTTSVITPPVKTTATPKHAVSYTVVAGDSLTSIAIKFNSTRKKLKALNNLASNSIKPGQVLLVPSTKRAKSASTAVATTAKTKPHHTSLAAQPVQDFDIPASTFASCPVPSPTSDDETPSAAESGDSSAMTDDQKPVPVAKLVSPAEMAADESRQEQKMEAAMLTPKPAPIAPAPSGLLHPNSPHGANLSGNNALTSTLPQPSGHFNSNAFSNQSSTTSTAATDWSNRFLTQARALGNEGIGYDDDWRPPGEPHSWTMDCSNTTRYLYKVTTGIELPRTASDQYYYLHQQGKAWDVPQIANGLPDTSYLRQNLKPGDLLFWENTYRPERQPPITHVMVYLGTNAQGQLLMAGSQSSRGGEHNRHNGGPDVYFFRPSQPCGGYTTWLGMVHHTGRFCAFGRPLEADRSKLTVAENN